MSPFIQTRNPIKNNLFDLDINTWVTKINTVVSNHFYSIKILLFSSARSRDFDGM
jgi:hypothetical protein